MAFSLNRITLIGNITKEPEIKYTPTGTKLAKFSLATNHGIKKGDNWENITTFHNIVAWGKLADNAERICQKGIKVYVEGRQENRSYTTQDSQKKCTPEVVANEIISTTKLPANPNQEQEPDIEQVDINLDEISFDLDSI